MTDPHYKTNDPYLSSFLVSQGAPLVGCQRLGPKTVEYRFVADRRLHGLLRFYWSGEPILLVPSRLLGALRQLKRRSLTQR